MKIEELVFNMFADSVVRIMDDPDREWRKPGEGQMNDFISLAVAGETLRRLCQAHLEEDDGPQPYAFGILEKYDQFLGKYTGEIPFHAIDTLAEILTDLTAYAEAPQIERSREDGVKLLDDLQETLMVIVASWRARRAIDERVVIDCGQRACMHIDTLAPKLGDLWQYAEDHELMAGMDPNFINLYGFWENLASLSVSRIAFERAILDYAKQQRRIEDAVKRFEEKDKDDGSD